MLKIAVFDEEHEKDLEEEINHFLAELDDNQVRDIKYSVTLTIDDDGEQLYCYSALILYSI
ncbi:sporulation protein Cse60 [uncultured Metabacillus sp.]|uniref:sporulation protein Cse60 n=1 Tax=uncultured Metabacillus sp. TaxID=2860135 RepID=UPI002637C19A|nr:sporulation protein Cse60 [uncultured Metabacillus sp.]